MLELISIAVMIICIIALLYLVIRGYFKGKDTLMGTIIGTLFVIALFIIVPILQQFLNYDDGNLAMVIIYSLGMTAEALYRGHRARILKLKLKSINENN